MTRVGPAAVIADVALVAGVSTATVSRALNGDPHVRESTRRRVADAAAELDYRPSAAARSLRVSVPTRIVVVLENEPSERDWVELSGCEQVLRAAGIPFTVTVLPRGAVDRARLLGAIFAPANRFRIVRIGVSLESSELDALAQIDADAWRDECAEARFESRRGERAARLVSYAALIVCGFPGSDRQRAGGMRLVHPTAPLVVVGRRPADVMDAVAHVCGRTSGAILATNAELGAYAMLAVRAAHADRPVVVVGDHPLARALPLIRVRGGEYERGQRKAQVALTRLRASA